MTHSLREKSNAPPRDFNSALPGDAAMAVEIVSPQGEGRGSVIGPAIDGKPGNLFSARGRFRHCIAPGRVDASRRRRASLR